MQYRKLYLLAGFTLILASACTTTTRSVSESPRDPQLEQQSTTQQQPTRSTRGRSGTQLSTAQMDELTQRDVDQLLTRGQTNSHQVAQIFGQPHSITRSGDELYWNYTHQFRNERRNVGGLKSLTILFDRGGRVQDYDFQDNSYNLQ